MKRASKMMSKKLRQAPKRAGLPEYPPGDSGAVIVETVISLGIFLVMVLGFTQIYDLILTQQRQYAIATEMMMGPQEPSMVFDFNALTFEPLADDGSTTPSRAGFLASLGNFFTSRAPSDMVIHLRLAYLQIDAATGVVTGTLQAGGVASYPNGAAGACASPGQTSSLGSFMTEKLSAMSAFTAPDADGAQVAPALGPKLYDVQVSGTNYRTYMTLVPVVFMNMCQETVSPLWPMRASENFMLIPRRLLR